jgi:hypothetical protein
MTSPPASRPCESCPYRLDVPSGVWSREDYEKLPAYDEPTYAQPAALFLCHQINGRLCAGWAGCHDMDQSMALRMAALAGTMTAEAVEATLDYVSPVALHPSGTAAAEHGLAALDRPGLDAGRLMAKLVRHRPEIAGGGP